LKPDVCRRVVGRLPSPHIPNSLQKPLGSTARDDATVQLRHLPKEAWKTTVVYLVRSFRTYARIRSLTTGTFNRVVKDRIAIRLSGANSGLDGPATRANPAVLETLQTYVAAQHPVNASDSQNFQRFSTLGKPRWSRRPGSSTTEKQVPRRAFSPTRNDESLDGGSLRRATVWPSALH